MKDAIKAIVRGLAILVVLPAVITYHIRARIIGKDRSIQYSTQSIGLIPGLVGIFLRRAFLSMTLAECAPTALIEFGTVFSAVGTRIGDRVYIGPNCHIGLAEFGRDALVGSAVHVPSGKMTHGIDDPNVPIRDQPGRHVMVHIGEGSWIGDGAIVMDDVGRNSVIGAGTVVTKPVPDMVIAGGIPARVLRHRLAAVAPQEMVR